MSEVFRIRDISKSIPRCAQSQGSLEEQLTALREVANRLGLYDAADFIKRSK